MENLQEQLQGPNRWIRLFPRLAFSTWAICCYYNVFPGVGLLLACVTGGLVAHW